MTGRDSDDALRDLVDYAGRLERALRIAIVSLAEIRRKPTAIHGMSGPYAAMSHADTSLRRVRKALGDDAIDFRELELYASPDSDGTGAGDGGAASSPATGDVPG